MANRNFLLQAILATVVSLSLSVPVHSLQYVYVREDNNVTCPYNPCHTLAYYATHTAQYFLSHTQIVFLPGEHRLVNITIEIENVTNLSMVGKTDKMTGNSFQTRSNDAVIQCSGAAGVRFIHVWKLNLANLTFLKCGGEAAFDDLPNCMYAAIAFETVLDLTISGLVVANSTGYGVYAQRVFGQSAVVNSLFTYNSGTPEYDGGNAAFYYRNCPHTKHTSFLSVNFSQFLNGNGSHSNPLASGLVLWLACTNININLTSVTLCGNQVRNQGTGGNLAVIYRNRTSIVTNAVVITQSYICEGNAHLGGGAFVSFLEKQAVKDNQTSVHCPSSPPIIPEVIHFSNTHFIGNHARGAGSGLYVIVHEATDVYYLTGSIIIENCTFTNNSLQTLRGGGVAANIINHYVPGILPHGLPQFEISFSNCVFTDNAVIEGEYTSSSGSGVVFLVSEVTFINCTFRKNKCSAIAAIRSILIFKGNTTIEDNTGIDGGGLALCDRSYMYLTPYINIRIANNHARHSGGGIHAEDQCLQTKPLCFFQLDTSILSHPELVNTVHVHMTNNTAISSGSAVYGGSVQYCYVLEDKAEEISKLVGPEVFKKVFKIDHNPLDLSYISSNPFSICFCNDTGFPDCERVNYSVTTYPGEKISVTAVTVGQYNGTAPGTVLASIDEGDKASIPKLEHSQAINGTKCASLQYTVFPNDSSKTAHLKLTVEQPQFNKGFQYHTHPRHIAVSFKQCPLGFEFIQASCKCTSILATHGIKCNISAKTIHRTGSVWIGYYQYILNDSGSESTTRSIIFYRHCPFDYCKPNEVDIRVNDTWIDENNQCAFNRTGILCGECSNGFSLALGSSECLHCSDHNLLLLLAFALAGLLLVLFLLICNLTVSQGTLSGLIFYANIVQVNHAIFFQLAHTKNTWTYILSIFIAWVNLDMGIQTCFYTGMDAYQKTWLQFVFPIYIWLIAAVIVLLSRNTNVAKLIGRNGVQVLATLFLLSFAKLLRTIILVVSVVDLKVDRKNKTTTTDWSKVWLQDGNIPYLHGKHIPLFMVAVLLSVFLLPYALVLLTIQLLQKMSNTRFLSWVVKLKPFFDAYTGPYNDRYRFWTGLLLLVRMILFAIFALNAFSDPTLKLMATLLACTLVLTCGWILPGKSNGIYSQWPLNILESSFLLNLGALSATTAYILNHGRKHEEFVQLSATIALTTFIGIMLYHAYKQAKSTQAWQYFAASFQKRHQETPRIQEIGAALTPATTQTELDQYREPLLSD